MLLSLFSCKQKNYRQRVDELKFTSVADSSQMEHAKKSQELQSRGESWAALFSSELLCHGPGQPRDHSRCCPGTSQEPRSLPLNRLGPAFHRASRPPYLTHHISPLVAKDRCQLTFLLFGFQSCLVPSSLLSPSLSSSRTPEFWSL